GRGIDVDAARQPRAGPEVPVGERLGGAVQRAAAELDDEAGLLGGRDELARRYGLALELPAGERLEAGNAAGAELDQRLVGKLELPGFDGDAKLGLDREAAAHLLRLRRFVDLRGAGALGVLERELGVAQHLV